MKAHTGLAQHNGRIDLATAAIVGFGIVILWTPPTLAKKHTDPSPYAVLTDAPEKARSRHNSFESDPDAVAAGGKLFEMHCAECHGQKGGGSMRGANLLREEVQQATPGTIFWVLTNGVVRHGMPVWSKLPEQQRWQLVTFLQSLGSQSAKPSPH
jgi:mono/diheme cytochrome c family protein